MAFEVFMAESVNVVVLWDLRSFSFTEKYK